MRSEIRSQAEFDQLVHDVHKTVQDYFSLKFDHLRQGMCAGCGSKSHAALLTKFGNGESVNMRNFDHLALIERLQSMGNSHETAEATSAIIDGRRLDIELRRQPSNPRYSDISYVLEVRALDHMNNGVQNPFFFIMPTFESQSGEPYRVDSAYNYRHSSKFSVSRGPDGRGLLTVEGEQGRWGGGMYVYDWRHQQDDRNYKRVVSAALARKILPAISPRFNCQLYKPDRYEHGAWKLRISLGDVAKQRLGGIALALKIPALKKRLFLPDEGYRRDVDLICFKDGILEAHIYSNGVAEDENPTPISEVRAEIVRSLHTALDKVGLDIPPYWLQR
ncbi:hypothetical protein [Azotobacter vinelandii]|uniref:hypothetical protein n=1 Tax=Azotobacter vinelandii TaxID=354 RepID=UPI000772E31A|nr:hypothetical protein [Azotobacter vinelandii]